MFKRFSLLIFFLAGHFSAHSNTELSLIGAATYQHYSQDQMVLALYASDQSFEAQYTGAEEKFASLKIKFIQPVSRRAFTRILKYSIAINNSEEELENNWPSLDRFLNKIRGDFEPGDCLSVEKVGETVNVSVNGIIIFSTNDEAVFDLVLSAWIGDVPPSRPFKNALLGLENPEQHQTLFKSIAHNPERAAVIRKEWLKRVRKAPEVALAVGADSTTSNHSITNVAVSEEETKLIALVEDDEREIRNNLSPVADGFDENSTASVQNANVDGLISTETTSGESGLLTDIDFARQRYADKLAVHAKRYILYPKRAQYLSYTGKVTARVTINRFGEIVSIEYDDTTKFNLLNRAVERGLIKSQPFPEIPDNWEAEQFTFLVPVNFELNS